MMRFWVVLFVAAIVIVTAACGGDTTAPAGDSDATVSDVDQGAAEDAEASVGDAEAGKELFASTCAACHGEAGEGVEGLGKDMTASTFIAGLSDEDLLAFVKSGRPPGDPDNTTGVDMPPKGGNPALADDELHDIIAYMRSIHK